MTTDNLHEGSSEMPLTPDQELRRDLREMRREIKDDFNGVHQKLNAMNERLAGHIGNEAIHRGPEQRPCRYFEDHVKEHEGTRARTWALVLLVVSNSIGLLTWASSSILKGMK